MDPAIFKLGRKTSNDVCDSLSRFGYSPKKSRVFIKPNIPGAYSPREPYMTNPKVVEGVIKYLHEIGTEDIAIGEGPISENSQHVFKKTGYQKLCKKTGITLLDLHETERKHINAFGRRISIPRPVLESEYINISKLKTHEQTGVTLCLKNQKGLLTLQERRSAHNDLHRNIARLYSVVKPDLSIVDATSGVEGNGPGATGKPVRGINLLVIGSNALRTDFLSSMLMGAEPEKIEHLKTARGRRGICFSPQTLEALSKHRMRFKEPIDHDRKLKFYYWFTDETCSGCTETLKDLKTYLLKTPSEWFGFLCNGILRRVDILSGKSKVPENHGKLICIGNCTRHFAEKEGIPWVPGCPPKAGDILAALKNKRRQRI